ncbi:MAG: HIT domain-containing protein [Phycisphaeraceae bacterium]
MSTDNLWAPWRMQYLKQLDPDEGFKGDAVSRCFLCEAVTHAAGSDEANRRFILHNDDRGLILLNRFPYTNGHLLIAPRQHLGDLTDLSPAQRADLIELTALAEQIVRLAYNPQGLNMGINIGRCAGAGLPGHLHMHVLPRWGGDTNFITTVGEIRVIPQALEESFALLASAARKVL